ncbi:MAG: FecR domain-containing protein [Burkholderiales bacterium]|nr:FecR domain-containing protein [Burkholderiales bacterium]
MRTTMRRFSACAAFLAGVLGPTAVHAQAAGTVTHLSGTLSVARPDGQRLLAVNSAVREGDLLTTERETYARIKFSDGAEVVLRPNSQLQVARYQFDSNAPERDSMLFSMVKGGMRAVTGLIGRRNRDRVGVTTPTATVGIRGTHFGLLHCAAGSCAGIQSAGGRPLENGLHVDIATGTIIVTNSAGSVLINAGQFGFVADQSTLPRVVPPEAGLRVTMPNAISTAIASRGVGIGLAKDDVCVMQ